MANWAQGEYGPDYAFVIDALIDHAVAQAGKETNGDGYGERTYRQAARLLDAISNDLAGEIDDVLRDASNVLVERLEEALAAVRTPSNPLPHPPATHRNGGNR